MSLIGKTYGCRGFIAWGVLTTLVVGACGTPTEQSGRQSLQPLEVFKRQLNAAYRTDAPALMSCVNGSSAALLSAHRGSWSRERPQNSMMALRDAALLPVIIEFDVVNANDGVPVVIHDQTLDRETTGSGPVADINSTDFVNLSLRNEDGAIMDDRPSTLSEVLDEFADDTLLMIDLKDPNASPTLDALAERDAFGGVTYVAYSLQQLAEIFERYADAIVFYRIDDMQEFGEVERIAPSLHQIVQLSNVIGLDNETRQAILASDIGLSTGYGRLEAGVGDSFQSLTASDYASLADGSFDALSSDRISHAAPILYGPDFEIFAATYRCARSILDQ